MLEERLAAVRGPAALGKALPRGHRREYPRLADFRALAGKLDPAGKFRDPFLERHVLEG